MLPCTVSTLTISLLLASFDLHTDLIAHSHDPTYSISLPVSAALVHRMNHDPETCHDALCHSCRPVRSYCAYSLSLSRFLCAYMPALQTTPSSLTVYTFLGKHLLTPLQLLATDLRSLLRPAMSSSYNSAVNPLTPMDTSSTALIATLVLLLAISSAIVIRSLILRRRHQRLVEEAIRTGTWLPHHFESGPRRRRDIGQKPKLWEAWLTPNDDDSDESEKGKWSDIMVSGPVLCGAFPLSVCAS